jgi:CRP-like cAMP-binding protein
MPHAQLQRLARDLVLVDLPAGKRLNDPSEPMKYVYFVESGMISTDAVDRQGTSVQIYLTGREGFAGVAAAMKQPEQHHVLVVQGAGQAYRLPAALMYRELHREGPLLDLLFQFLHLRMVTTAQSALCNRVHQVQPRLARWLLTAADRMESHHLELTHEMLAGMLGSRRSTVTVTATRMQQRRLIEYRRGKLNIIDRRGLERTACECYGVVKTTYDSLMTGKAKN